MSKAGIVSRPVLVQGRSCFGAVFIYDSSKFPEAHITDYASFKNISFYLLNIHFFNIYILDIYLFNIFSNIFINIFLTFIFYIIRYLFNIFLKNQYFDTDIFLTFFENHNDFNILFNATSEQIWILFVCLGISSHCQLFCLSTRKAKYRSFKTTHFSNNEFLKTSLASMNLESSNDLTL